MKDSFVQDNNVHYLAPPERPEAGAPPALDSGRPARNVPVMPDTEVRRLEDRIEAANREQQMRLDAVSREQQLRLDAISREGQMRLDTALARIDGKFEAITSDMKAIREDVKSSRTEAKTQFQWLMGLLLGVIVPLIVAAFLGTWTVIIAQSANDRTALANVIAAFSAGQGAKPTEPPKP